MNDFLILTKQEFKNSFNLHRKGEKHDFIGSLLALLIVLIVAAAFIFLALNLVKTYLQVKIDNVYDPKLRATELINVFYFFTTIILVIFSLEKLRKMIANHDDKVILLRLPVKSQTIFFSKFFVIYVLTIIMGIILVIPTNIIFSIAFKQGAYYLFSSLVVIFLLPVFTIFIASILIVPYIKIVNFFKNKNLLTLIFYILAISVGFIVYSILLDILKNLLETGNIKYIFNANFVNFLGEFLKYAYPSNLLARIMFSTSLLSSFLTIGIGTVVILIIAYFITRRLFYHTLYKNEVVNDKIIRKKVKPLNPFISLVKKEFKLVFRTNEQSFSYFAIALSMPLVIYCCFFLFRELIYNSIGLRIDFELSLFVLLIFIVLTNTFCATNITRDGKSFLKSKTFPISAKYIIYSKVVFCAIVSSIAVVVSVITLNVISDINALDTIILLVSGLLFSISQILLGTRMDLNNAKLSLSKYEIDNETSKTVAKLVFVGLVVAVFIGVFAIGGTLLLPSVAKNIPYVLIIRLSVLGFVILFSVVSYLYFRKNIEKRYYNLVL